MSHTALQPEEYEALTRLLRLANNDTPAARSAANFLLAWCDSPAHGGFDFTDLLELDEAQRTDLLTVMGYAVRTLKRPDWLGFSDELGRIRRLWRPDPVSASAATQEPPQ